MEEKVVKYILKKLGGASPFKLSRLLILIELEYRKRYGEKPFEFYYMLYPQTFYIEGFSDFMLNIKGIEKQVIEYPDGRKEGSFILNSQEEIKLPDEVKEIIDMVIENFGKLSEMELNKKVVERADYQELLR